MYLEYEKVIDALTIDPTQRLQKEVHILKREKSKNDLILLQIEEMQKMINQLQSGK